MSDMVCGSFLVLNQSKTMMVYSFSRFSVMFRALSVSNVNGFALFNQMLLLACTRMHEFEFVVDKMQN